MTAIRTATESLSWLCHNWDFEQEGSFLLLLQMYYWHTESSGRQEDSSPKSNCPQARRTEKLQASKRAADNSSTKQRSSKMKAPQKTRPRRSEGNQKQRQSFSLADVHIQEKAHTKTMMIAAEQTASN